MTDYSESPSSIAQLRSGLQASCSGRCVGDYRPRLQGAGNSFGSFMLLRELNRGATAVVYEAVNCGDGSSTWGSTERVALKVLNTTPEGAFCVPASVVQREISCSSNLSHRNIVSLLDVVASRNGLALVLELVDGPDLLEYVEACHRQVPEEVAVYYFRQLLDAVAHLHASKVAHRDLKPENCMIDLQNHTLKVIDFGLASSLDARVPLGCGTIFTIAPECVAQEGGSARQDAAAVDVWGLGVTLYITLVGKFPFQDPRRPQDDQTTIRNTLAGRMNPIPDRVSPTARHLILSLLQTDPAKRPLLEQISVHPFVTQRVRHQHVFAFEAKVFAGTYGLPHVSAVRTAIVSDALSTTPRSDTTGMDPVSAAGCLLDRFLCNNTPQSTLQRDAALGSASPAGVRTKARSMETTSWLQPEVVKAAMQGSAGPTPPPATPQASCGHSSGTCASQLDDTETWSTLPQCSQAPQAPESVSCMPHTAKKLFTLSADARPSPEPPSFSTKRSMRLLPVPEGCERAESARGEWAEVDRSTSLASNASVRSDLTTFAAPATPKGSAVRHSPDSPLPLLSNARTKSPSMLLRCLEAWEEERPGLAARCLPMEKRRHSLEVMPPRRRPLFASSVVALQ